MNTTYKIIFIVLLCCVRVVACDKYEIIKTHAVTNDISGIACGVFGNTQEEYINYGWAISGPDKCVRVTSDTVFSIGSISKGMLAATTLVFCSQNKLSLEDRIHKFLPDAPASWTNITVRNILSHVAGFPIEIPKWTPENCINNIDLVNSLYQENLLFRPGCGFKYSNAGYFVLAEILTITGQKPWYDSVQEIIFTPLDMTSTELTTETKTINKRARGREKSSQYYVKIPRCVRPSGAFVSNIKDLQKYDQAIRKFAILTEQQQRETETKVVLQDGTTRKYGLGWIVDLNIVRHAGIAPGFRCEFSRFIDSEISVIILSNLGEETELHKLAKKLR